MERKGKKSTEKEGVGWREKRREKYVEIAI